MGGRGGGGCVVGAVLLEAVGAHGLVVFEESEVGRLEAADGVAFRVGDDDVDDGERDAGADGVLGLAWGGGAVGLYGALRGGLGERDGQSDGDKGCGGEKELCGTADEMRGFFPFARFKGRVRRTIQRKGARKIRDARKLFRCE